MASLSRSLPLVLVTLVAAFAPGCGGKVDDPDAGASSTATPAQNPTPGDTADAGANGPVVDPKFLATLRMENDLCLPQRLPLGADGATTCVIAIMLPALGADSLCNDYPGLIAATSAIDARVRQAAGTDVGGGHPVCTLQQIPQNEWVSGGCIGSSWAGWCYVEGAAAGGTCAQALQFSRQGGPPIGAKGWIACP
jgi:hypothetical protein